MGMRESTGTTWPSGLQTMFDICCNEQPQPDPPEMRYYGPYNTLFSWCFCSNTLPDFVVAPSNPPLSFRSLPDIDYPDVCFVVTDFHRHPVLVAEVKDDVWANKADLRARADDHMRRWFNAVLPDCRLPRVYGLSLLGTSLRVYVCNVATSEVEPAFATRPSLGHTLPHDFLGGAWDLDILSKEGFTKMKEIVDDVIANSPLGSE